MSEAPSGQESGYRPSVACWKEPLFENEDDDENEYDLFGQAFLV